MLRHIAYLLPSISERLFDLGCFVEILQIPFGCFTYKTYLCADLRITGNSED